MIRWAADRVTDDSRTVVNGGDSAYPPARDGLVAQWRELQGGRKVDPQLETVRPAAAAHGGLGGHLVAEDARWRSTSQQRQAVGPWWLPVVPG